MDFLNIVLTCVDTITEFANSVLYPKKEYPDGIISTEYIQSDDIIIIFYYKKNKLYTLVVDRLNPKSPSKIVEECLEVQEEDHIMMAILNDTTDITTEINSIFGPGGAHLKYFNNIKLKFILTAAGIESFRSIDITDMMCDEYVFDDVNEILTVD